MSCIGQLLSKVSSQFKLGIQQIASLIKSNLTNRKRWEASCSVNTKNQSQDKLAREHANLAFAQFSKAKDDYSSRLKFSNKRMIN